MRTFILSATFLALTAGVALAAQDSCCCEDMAEGQAMACCDDMAEGEGCCCEAMNHGEEPASPASPASSAEPLERAGSPLSAG